MNQSREAWQTPIGLDLAVSQRLPPQLTMDEAGSSRAEGRQKEKIDSSAPLCIRSGEEMKWLCKMIFPGRRVFGGVTSRIHFRQSGLLKLRSDVRACEYEDVRVMWEMLKRNETEPVRSDGSKKRQIWNFLEWATSAPCLGRRF